MKNYPRVITVDDDSYFLFGPRGTGKTIWLKTHYPNAYFIDLLDAATRLRFSANPQRLGDVVRANLSRRTFVVDEIQKVPQLLDEVHRLIESYPDVRFVLTGSSARKLRSAGVDLLGGRAMKRSMHPFMACELGADFSLDEALRTGLVPVVGKYGNRERALSAYLNLYMREEIEQEGLVRNLDTFSRFLEAVSFSHGAVLSATVVSQECAVKRTTVDGYLAILKDLMLSGTLGVFPKHAKRKLIAHEKFYFFDAGVYRVIRPKGALDRPEEIAGAALEGLVYQHLSAWCDYSGFDKSLYYWRTANGDEVDFVVYTERAFVAIEVKHTARPNKADFAGLRLFGKDYPQARRILLYRGQERRFEDDILVLPVDDFLMSLYPGKDFEI